MMRFITFLVFVVLLSIGLRTIADTGDLNSGQKRLTWDSEFDRSTYRIKAIKSGLSLFSDSGELLTFVPKEEFIDVNLGQFNNQHGILVVPDSEKKGAWEYSRFQPDPIGGRPATVHPGKRIFRNDDALLISFLFFFLVIALIRVLNSYSYSFLVQPITTFGRGLDLERFSSGVFPIIFLGVFIGFSTLLGFVLDLVIPGVYSFEISSGGFIVGETPSAWVFFLLSLAFVIVRFVFYNLLSFITDDKSLGTILFSSSLIMASVLLIFLTILVSLLGFGNFVYDHPRIVAFIFIIFAALFGIGMLFTHLNMGIKVPVSVRFFGIVAMEILPTVVIVKVLFEG